MDKEKIALTLKNLNKLAINEISHQNYSKALQYFAQGLYLEYQLGLKIQMAETFFNLAGTYYLMEEYEKALHKIQLAENLFQENGKADDALKARQMKDEILHITSANP